MGPKNNVQHSRGLMGLICERGSETLSCLACWMPCATRLSLLLGQLLFWPKLALAYRFATLIGRLAAVGCTVMSITTLNMSIQVAPVPCCRERPVWRVYFGSVRCLPPGPVHAADGLCVPDDCGRQPDHSREHAAAAADPCLPGALLARGAGALDQLPTTIWCSSYCLTRFRFT